MADSDKEASTGVVNSSKMKNKKKVKSTVNRVKEEKLVLTPSEKALGILIAQPKQQTIDTMTKLHAVPSEEIRVWTCWLTKVGERADDWQWWLRGQIGLTVRISDHLQQAVIALEREKNDKLGQEDVGTSDAGTDVPEEVETEVFAKEVSDADVTTGIKPTLDEQEVNTTKDEVPAELGNIPVTLEGEPEDTKKPEKVSVAKRSQGKGNKDKRQKGKKVKGGKLEPKIMYKEGFWPIGVRWKPLSQRTSNRKPPPERKPDEIPMPKNEEEMTELIKKFKHQGVVYQSFYKHWLQTGDQAIKEIVGRKVLPTKQVYSNGKDVPYFFYLESEPDMNYVVEYDDEEILLADPGRERITREYKHLYFNLTDKPGKGGKPWI